MPSTTTRGDSVEPITTFSAVKPRTIRIMLVDDHPLLRGGLRAILSLESDLELAAEASSGPEALSILAEMEERPEVLLLDVRMAEMDGFAVLREVRARFPEQLVIMLTMYASEEYLQESLLAGANGYVLKDQACELIPLAVRTVAAGGTVVPPDLLDRMLAAGGSLAKRREPVDCPLSPREVSIVRLIARGYSNRAIAEELHLAEATIKKYVQSLTGKLGANDRGHAAILGMRLGIVE